LEEESEEEQQRVRSGPDQLVQYSLIRFGLVQSSSVQSSRAELSLVKIQTSRFPSAVRFEEPTPRKLRNRRWRPCLSWPGHHAAPPAAKPRHQAASNHRCGIRARAYLRGAPLARQSRGHTVTLSLAAHHMTSPASTPNRLEELGAAHGLLRFVLAVAPLSPAAPACTIAPIGPVARRAA
jgi:hypothetical protein